MFLEPLAQLVQELLSREILARRSDDRSQFLGVWRLIGDAGMSGAPLLSAALLSVASLAAASFVVAALGFVGAIVMLTSVPETLDRAA